MGVSEKRQNFHFGVEYPFKYIKNRVLLYFHSSKIENGVLLLLLEYYFIIRICFYSST